MKLMPLSMAVRTMRMLSLSGTSGRPREKARSRTAHWAAWLRRSPLLVWAVWQGIVGPASENRGFLTRPLACYFDVTDSG